MGRKMEQVYSGSPVGASILLNFSNGEVKNKPQVASAPRHSWTHEELMAEPFPPMQWTIQNLLPEGLGILSGKPKIGKGFMGLQIGVAAASAGQFLGHQATAGPVLFIALEDGARRIQDRLKLMGADAVPLPIDFEFEWAPLNLQGTNDLGSRLAKGSKWGPYVLVIIDTLASAKTGRIDENKAGDMAGLMNAVQQVAQRHRCCILLIFHHRKKGTGDPVYDPRGSTATPAGCDALLGLYKEQEAYMLRTVSRDGPELELKLRRDFVNTFSWQLIGRIGEVPRNKVQEDILDALDELKEADVATIAEEVGKTYTPVSKTLKAMHADGLLGRRPAKTSRGSDKFLYRRATKDGKMCWDSEDFISQEGCANGGKV